jgi:hypothetical protein
MKIDDLDKTGRSGKEEYWKFIKEHEQDDPAHLVLKQKQFPDLPLKPFPSPFSHS